MVELFSDEYFMKIALQEAQKSFGQNEVPIGAIIVSNNQVIAKAHNSVETLNDVTAHAEMVAITSASNFLGSKYLNDCTIYITIEPCVMCAGAIAWSQIGRIVYGASDDKKGYTRYGKNIIHSKVEIVAGILENECSDIIKLFFKGKR